MKEDKKGGRKEGQKESRKGKLGIKEGNARRKGERKRGN
jgi:hypothetical protein